MLTEKMTYTVSTITPNTQVGDIVYVKSLDSGAHAIGEVDHPSSRPSSRSHLR